MQLVVEMRHVYLIGDAILKGSAVISVRPKPGCSTVCARIFAGNHAIVMQEDVLAQHGHHQCCTNCNRCQGQVLLPPHANTQRAVVINIHSSECQNAAMDDWGAAEQW